MRLRFARRAAHGSRDAVAKASHDEISELRWLEVLTAVPKPIVVGDRHGSVEWRNSAALSSAGTHGDLLINDALSAVLASASRGQQTQRTVELFGPPRRVVTIDAQPLAGGGAVAVIDDATEVAGVRALHTDFVANVSHELKTPLGALALLAETIAESLTSTTDKGGIDEPTRRLALRLTDEAHRAAATVDGLLELSQMDERRQPLARVSLGTIVDESVERVIATAEHRMADIVRDGDDVLVWGDERQLVSAVSNLLENAVKYSESGSPIRVTVAEHSDSIAVTVADQGIGIAPHDQPRVFDRFFRVDRARRRATGGTGLGLAIVRQVAIAHGGDVSVASREGEGSTFVLRLPKDAR